MRMDRTVTEPKPPATPSWDNSSLRNRLEQRPAPGAAVEALHALAQERETLAVQAKRSRRRRRR
ncbi:MAG: hypothetical protein ABI572_05345 [Actinomycetota bacterium]